MNILQIGYGNMGSIFIDHLAKYYNNITIFRKSEKPTPYATINSLDGITDFDVIIVAIKPQDFPSLAESINAICTTGTIIVSVMAGVGHEALKKHIPNTENFIRIMPNLGMANGNGVSVVYDAIKSDLSRELIKNACSGMMIAVNSDDDIAKLTPFSGCASAYFLLMADVIYKNAIALGVEDALALQSTKNLMQSAVDIVKQLNDGGQFAVGIAKIASKGGVTVAALDAMNADIENGIAKGMVAGYQRASALEEQLEKS